MSLEQKKQQFEEFFLISWPLKANVLQFEDKGCALQNQSMEMFESSMPYAFRISANMNDIHSKSHQLLKKIGDKVNDLIDYLELQAEKIDLMMSYILQQQDSAQDQVQSVKFGGAGLIIEDERDIEIGETCIVKLFIESERAAVYTYAEAIEVNVINEKKQTSLLFTHIREEDQELLVKASLHLQTQSLRKRNNKSTNA